MYIYDRINSVKEMCISKFKVALVVIILSAIPFLALTIAPLTRYYTIHSSGSIGSPVTQQAVSYESEIRALFVHGANMLYPDWETIASTVQSYGVNTIIVEVLYPHGSRYPSNYVESYTRDELTPAINAAHARGMKLHVSFNVLLGAFNDEQKVVGADGGLRDWTCPTKAVSRAHIKVLTEELASFQAQSGPHAGDTADGFMLDYIRYGEGMTDTCYCPECKAKFEQYLGEGPISDWTPFLPGGARYNEFMEWRPTPINELVRDMRNWALGVNPNLEISAAVWSISISGNPTYYRYWIGQDSTYWIKEGWLDWVAPMLYVGAGETAFLTSLVQENLQYGTGGPEGKIPMAPFLTHVFISKTPSQFKAEVDVLRANGADGWVLWRYGGPGDGQGSGAPDIRQYLGAIELPEVFSLTNLAVTLTGTGTKNATITWSTTKPATSKVEYSTSPLFNASYEYLSMYDFHYWDIDHVEGTIVEDTTPVTSHMITLTGLQEGTLYYYRVQSQDSSGIATSQVYTFEL